jgi:hypothetical protein
MISENADGTVLGVRAGQCTQPNNASRVEDHAFMIAIAPRAASASPV